MPAKPRMSDNEILDRFNEFLVAKKYGSASNNLRNTLLFAQSLSDLPKMQ